jgi:ligand-binding SRPBCC domain-containing protein
MARITEFEWNSHFCDEQMQGPFKTFTHRHGIEAESRDGMEGTLVSDVVEFELPYGGMGRIGGAIVRRQLARTFAYRQKHLSEIMAAVQRQSMRRA